MRQQRSRRSGQWGGQSKHIDVRLNFLRELKESNTIRVTWIDTDSNTGDLYTKNLEPKTFERHMQVHCGKDEKCDVYE